MVLIGSGYGCWGRPAPIHPLTLAQFLLAHISGSSCTHSRLSEAKEGGLAHFLLCHWVY